MKVKRIAFIFLTLFLSSPSVAVDPVPIKGCTKTSKVPDGIITCLDFARANGCTISDLVAWNPGLRSDCLNLNAGLLLCVSVTPLKTTPATSIPPGTSVPTTTPVQVTTQTTIPTAPPVLTTTSGTATTSANSSVSTSNTVPTQTKTSGAGRYSMSIAFYPVLATSVVLFINVTKSLVRNLKANRKHHSIDSIKSSHSYFNDYFITQDGSQNVKFLLGRETATTSATPSTTSPNTIA